MALASIATKNTSTNRPTPTSQDYTHALNLHTRASLSSGHTLSVLGEAARRVRVLIHKSHFA